MPNHEDYVWYKEHGICPACKHAKASPGRVLCDECLEKQRETDRIRRMNNTFWMEYKRGGVQCT